MDGNEPLVPVPPGQYGAVLAELRQAVCHDDGVVKRIANNQIDFGSRMAGLELKVGTFVDPITRRARASLIFGGSAVGGFFAGLLVELAVRLLAQGAGHILAGAFTTLGG